jgi:hypothetical protein
LNSKYSTLPLVPTVGGGKSAVGSDAGERGASSEGHGEGVGGVRGVEVPQDLVGVPGLGGAGPGAVQLRRRVRHLLLEDGKHFLRVIAATAQYSNYELKQVSVDTKNGTGLPFVL